MKISIGNKTLELSDNHEVHAMQVYFKNGSVCGVNISPKTEPHKVFTITASEEGLTEVLSGKLPEGVTLTDSPVPCVPRCARPTYSGFFLCRRKDDPRPITVEIREEVNGSLFFLGGNSIFLLSNLEKTAIFWGPLKTA